MRQIKFRGRSLYSGELVYGNLTHGTDGNFYIFDGRRPHWVDPESVAQLVGHDKNGKEVYEGDVVIDDSIFGNEYRARLRSDAIICYGCEDITEDIEDCTLKEVAS